MSALKNFMLKLTLTATKALKVLNGCKYKFLNNNYCMQGEIELYLLCYFANILQTS